jgi:hypothetical protein
VLALVPPRICGQLCLQVVGTVPKLIPHTSRGQKCTVDRRRFGAVISSSRTVLGLDYLPGSPSIVPPCGMGESDFGPALFLKIAIGIGLLLRQYPCDHIKVPMLIIWWISCNRGVASLKINEAQPDEGVVLEVVLANVSTYSLLLARSLLQRSTWSVLRSWNNA